MSVPADPPSSERALSRRDSGPEVPAVIRRVETLCPRERNGGIEAGIMWPFFLGRWLPEPCQAPADEEASAGQAPDSPRPRRYRSSVSASGG
jgi:hypothetical protein